MDVELKKKKIILIVHIIAHGCHMVFLLKDTYTQQGKQFLGSGDPWKGLRLAPKVFFSDFCGFFHKFSSFFTIEIFFFNFQVFHLKGTISPFNASKKSASYFIPIIMNVRFLRSHIFLMIFKKSTNNGQEMHEKM